MNRSILLYGLGLAGLLILLKWLEWRFMVFDHAIELYSGALALVFTGLGIWLAVKLARPKVRTVVVVQPAPEAPEQDMVAEEVRGQVGPGLEVCGEEVLGQVGM